MGYKNIIVEREGAVATITLNRTERRNALTYSMIGEILQALQEVESNATVRALVFTGAGTSFCAGDDIKGMGDLPSPLPPGLSPIAAYQHALVKAIRHMPKPVIAALNGYTLGMGLDIAMACDIRIASDEAMLGEPRIHRALYVATGSTYLMPRLIGMTRAIELYFMGEYITAREAERIGLVTRTVPASEFAQTVRQLAERFAAGPTKVFGIIKEQVYGQFTMDMEQAMAHMLEIRKRPVEDQREGLLAFAEKRKPMFVGR